MKRIALLLMIGMLIFSISACSENTVSDVSSQTTSNTNDVSSVEDTVSDVSSEATSSRPTINYEGTDVTPPDSDKVNGVTSKNFGTASTSSVSGSLSGDFVHIYDEYETDRLALVIAEDAVDEYKDISAEKISQRLNVDVIKVVDFGIASDARSDNKTARHLEIYVKEDSLSNLNKLASELSKHDDVMYANLVIKGSYYK